MAFIISFTFIVLASAKLNDSIVLFPFNQFEIVILSVRLSNSTPFSCKATIKLFPSCLMIKSSWVMAVPNFSVSFPEASKIVSCPSPRLNTYVSLPYPP